MAEPSPATLCCLPGAGRVGAPVRATEDPEGTTWAVSRRPRAASPRQAEARVPVWLAGLVRLSLAQLAHRGVIA